jgi:disulfide bond formation protein DsbB
MWRVILSVVAISIDLLILLLMVIGMATEASHAPLQVAVRAGPEPVEPHTVIVTLVVAAALFGSNILAILFGARLPATGERRRALARVFE